MTSEAALRAVQPSGVSALRGLEALPLPRLLTVPAYAVALALVEDQVSASVERARASAIERAGAAPA